MSNDTGIIPKFLVCVAALLTINNACITTPQIVEPKQKVQSKLYFINNTSDTILSTITFCENNTQSVVSISPLDSVLFKTVSTDSLQVLPSDVISAVLFSVYNSAGRIVGKRNMPAIRNSDWVMDAKSSEKSFYYTIKEDTTYYYFVNLTSDSIRLIVLQNNLNLIDTIKVNNSDTLFLGKTTGLSAWINPSVLFRSIKIPLTDSYGNPIGLMKFTDADWDTLYRNNSLGSGYILTYKNN